MKRLTKKDQLIILLAKQQLLSWARVANDNCASFFADNPEILPLIDHCIMWADGIRGVSLKQYSKMLDNGKATERFIRRLAANKKK